VDIRASDDDRQRVVAALERHAGAGRLTLDEFADRVDRVVGARTMADLAAVTQDLPGDAGHPPRRDLLLVFAIAIATLLVLGLYMAVR